MPENVDTQPGGRGQVCLATPCRTGGIFQFPIFQCNLLRAASSSSLFSASLCFVSCRENTTAAGAATGAAGAATGAAATAAVTVTIGDMGECMSL